MNKAAVVIGIDNYENLPALSSCRSSAERFADWAEGQGFSVSLITDESGDVTKQRIKRAIKDIVESRRCDQLIVYFSGHGILRGPDFELWILSQCPSDPDEAVYVSKSIADARYNSNIPNIVFISDACRSNGLSHSLSSVDGGSIFPVFESISGDPSTVDLFYATLPGQPAYELPMDTAIKRYRSVFTQHLLAALKGWVGGVVVPDGKDSLVVPAGKVKKYLKDSIPTYLESVSLRLSQFPDIRVESEHPPTFLSRFPLPPNHPPIEMDASGSPAEIAPPNIEIVLGDHNVVVDPGITENRDEGFSPASTSQLVQKVFPQVSTEQANTLSFMFSRLMSIYLEESRNRSESEGEEVNRILKSVAYFTRNFVTDRPYDEYTPSLSVYGDLNCTINTAFDLRHGGDSLPGQLCRGMNNSDSQESHLLFLLVWKPDFVLVNLEIGHVLLPVLQGYDCQIVVQEQQILTISFISKSGRGFSNYEYGSYYQTKALAVAAAQLGLFQLNKNQAEVLGDILRRNKRFDPTLGILAAYAYSSAGRQNDISSVERFMIEDLDFQNDTNGRILLPDVSILSKSSPSTLPRPAMNAKIPRIPLLTSGLAFIDHSRSRTPELVIQALRNTLPGLWTTFETSQKGKLLEMLMYPEIYLYI